MSPLLRWQACITWLEAGLGWPPPPVPGTDLDQMRLRSEWDRTRPPAYSLAKLRADVVSGLTVASLAVPQGISYARLAGLDPVVGLCEY